MCVVSAVMFLNGGFVFAAGETASNSASFGYIAAALSTGLACIGAGIAVGS